MNLGECLLTRYDSSYALLSRILYQMEYSRKAKKTFLRTFELYDSDSEEEYDVNVENSFNADGTAKNGCGRRSKMITDKKKSQSDYRYNCNCNCWCN